MSGPDLSCITELSKYLNVNAKNVTNLLILLTVLAAGQILCLSFYKLFLYFSRLSHRVAGKGWKALYAKYKLHIKRNLGFA